MSRIISEVRKLVKTACLSDQNKFGVGAWNFHIESVYIFSQKLAKELGADQEVCLLAALFHDYASVINIKYYSRHHIKSAQLAEEYLRKTNYPADKIRAITEAIKLHRGSRSENRSTLEAKILASADAMAHIENVESLLYLAYAKQHQSIKGGADWVRGKLERSWNKLMPEAKEMIKYKYEAAVVVLKGHSPTD